MSEDKDRQLILEVPRGLLKGLSFVGVDTISDASDAARMSRGYIHEIAERHQGKP